MTDNPQLAEIKARLGDVRERIARGDRTVPVGPFGAAQLGLTPVYADAAGRLWRYSGDELVLIQSGPRLDDDTPYQAGARILGDVAVQFGLDAQTMRGESRYGEYTAARVEFYRRAAAAGISFTTMGRLVGRSASAIKYHARKAGIVRRGGR